MGAVICACYGLRLHHIVKVYFLDKRSAAMCALMLVLSYTHMGLSVIFRTTKSCGDLRSNYGLMLKLTNPLSDRASIVEWRRLISRNDGDWPTEGLIQRSYGDGSCFA